MQGSLVRSAPASANLYEILDLLLDKGLVVDVFVRVSLVGIEILAVEARIVIASVDTFLRYAEAIDDLGSRRRRLGIQPGGSPLSNAIQPLTGALARGLGQVADEAVGPSPQRHAQPVTA